MDIDIHKLISAWYYPVEAILCLFIAYGLWKGWILKRTSKPKIDKNSCNNNKHPY
jgi:hypothetical protein